MLRRALPDQKVVFSLQVIRDGFIHVIAGDAERARIDDAGHRDDSDVSRATTDIYHQVAAGLGDGQTGANGGHHRLLY